MPRTCRAETQSVPRALLALLLCALLLPLAACGGGGKPTAVLEPAEHHGME